ncbi:DNA cytosine methyltransferase [Citrifermentans bremense]|uniref:DNA cytosine methyltransferase n=1 Tax=Citrifermentans bremense TaxID=60035 RepID=UPI00040B0259|nr:DNA cytosine methyltransferase [Citrifermentans bremense]
MLKAISLFTGIGGLDFGFEAAGFSTAVAVEMDAVACRELRRNRDWPLLADDIHKFSSQQILDTGGLVPGEADVLIGGPPCQPFSKSGYWAGGDAARLSDPRSSTLEAYLRVLRDCRPKTFLLENVHGLAFKGKDEGLKFLLEGIQSINKGLGTNYIPYCKKLNAAEYGVPQSRERVFLIGSRDGKPFRFPERTHCTTDDVEGIDSGLMAYKTAWDALGDLPADAGGDELRVKGKWGELLPSIPEGNNYLWHTGRGGGMPLFGWRTRYWSFLLKLKKDQPSWTIQAQPGPAIGPFHWRNRMLSGRELCRLQTFPDNITFGCSRSEVQKLVGNAVPSLLAEVLALEIKRQLLGVPADAALKLLPPSRGVAPPPEPVYPVPEKYHHLLGDHADHPGEGRGRGAAVRQIEQDLF